MENEKIYVVVPVYKVEAYLERCVESILNQTYDNYELILVDDGSPDNCPAICDQYAEKYNHITVIHQENGGLSAARNTGIEYALERGNPEQDWINFIDSDDFVHPRYLEYLYRAAKEAGTDISSCGFTRTETTEIDASEIGELKYACLTPEEYWCKNGPNAARACGKLYKLALFKDIMYPVGKIHEDAFTTHKVAFQCTMIAASWIRLYYYYVNPQSITTSMWTPNRMDVLDACEEQLEFFLANGYKEAYVSSIQFLFWSSNKQIMLIRGLSPQYDNLIAGMRKRRKKAFKLYASEIGMVEAVLYFFEIRLMEPAKRILRKESILSFLKRRIKKKLGLR